STRQRRQVHISQVMGLPIDLSPDLNRADPVWILYRSRHEDVEGQFVTSTHQVLCLESGTAHDLISTLSDLEGRRALSRIRRSSDTKCSAPRAPGRLE